MMTLPIERSRRPVRIIPELPTDGWRLGELGERKADYEVLDAKANKEMAEKAKGKGPLNAGQQGIKKSGKK